ncbi:peroxiredoxin [soil metagenome]
MAVDVGDRAPGFELAANSWDEIVALDDVSDKGPVVLFFYPGDWSSVCTDQMGRIQERIGHFEEKGAKVLAISADTPWSYRAFAEDRGIEFPLLSDFDRTVIPAYGVEHEVGFPERAYFVIDREGIVRAKRVEESPKDQPDLDDVIRDLEKAL